MTPGLETRRCHTLLCCVHEVLLAEGLSLAKFSMRDAVSEPQRERVRELESQRRREGERRERGEGEGKGD